MALWTDDKCWIIAEGGSNHDGSFSQACELIEVAADAGVDAIKFQAIPPFERAWMDGLQANAVERGLDFLVTPFDLDAVEVVAEYCPAIKIASPEIVNMDLLRAVARTERPLILSTGMATLGDIERALTAVSQALPSRTPPNPTPSSRTLSSPVLMQCTSSYPAAPAQINLRAMQTMRESFRLPVGLSDHSEGIAIPIAGAALGSIVLEKHFTLSRGLQGPDHGFAIEPDELKAMVEGIRQAEQALGDGRKSGPQEGELVEARGRRLEWTT